MSSFALSQKKGNELQVGTSWIFRLNSTATATRGTVQYFLPKGNTTLQGEHQLFVMGKDNGNSWDHTVKLKTPLAAIETSRVKAPPRNTNHTQ